MNMVSESQGIKAWLRKPQPWITLGFGLAFYALIKGFEGQPIPSWPYQSMMGQTAFLLVCLTMMGIAWLFHGRSWTYYLLTHLFAFGFGAATLMVWQATPIGPSGVVGDAWFNTAMVVKHRDGMGNTDFAYKGLHAFYPTLYQWVVGVLGALTSTSGPKAMKYGFYWTAFLLPIAGYGLWRKLLPMLPAFLMVVIAMALVRINLSFKTFEVISIVLFIPWSLYYVIGLRLREVDGNWTWELARLQRREWIVGGIIGGLCFMTFYYYFFLFILWLPLQAMVEMRVHGWRAVWSRSKPVLWLIFTVMLVAAIYWVPLLIDMSRYGMHSYQNRWFQPHMLGLPFDDLHNWKEMLGLLTLVVLAPRNVFARSVLVMMIAVVAFILLGHLGIYRNFPLLHVRIVALAPHLLLLGFVIGLHHLVTYFKETITAAWAMGLGVGIATLYAISITMVYSYEANNDLTNLARNHRQPVLIGFPAFNQMARGKVFLTNRLELVALRPMYLFICPNAHYSHPASRFRERLKMLTLLQHSKDSDFIAWMLQYNRYDRVDHVLLDGNHLDLYDDNFPHLPNHIALSLQFDSTAFQGQYFMRDQGFREVVDAKDVPADLWHQFTPGQLRMAALFTDDQAVQAACASSTLDALHDELRIRTLDYVAWQRVFVAHYLIGDGRDKWWL